MKDVLALVGFLLMVVSAIALIQIAAEKVGDYFKSIKYTADVVSGNTSRIWDHESSINAINFRAKEDHVLLLDLRLKLEALENPPETVNNSSFVGIASKDISKGEMLYNYDIITDYQCEA